MSPALWQRTIAGREALYAQAWNVFLTHPFFGSGFQIPWVSLDGVHDIFAHNAILSTLAQAGVLGGICLLFFLATFVKRLQGQNFNQRFAAYLFLLWSLFDEPLFSALPLFALFAQLALPPTKERLA